MIVITGASDGLGYEIAKVYKAAGEIVVNVSRRNCDIADHNFLHDLKVADDITVAAQEIIALNEPLTALVNNAGVYSEEPIGKITEDEIKRVMATNVKSNILLTSELVEKIKSDAADVLCIISTAGTKGKAAHAVYAASKWAQRGYAKSLQDELKDSPSRVIIFCPGGIYTDFPDKTPTHGDNGDRSSWMKPGDLAMFIKQILDLPKNMEVSEVVINRK